MHQGPLLLPLQQIDDDDFVQAWGPKPLIRIAENSLLLVKCLEYEYHIQFPKNIQNNNEIYWKDFDTLSTDDQDNLLVLIEIGISHLLNDDEKLFLWSNRNALYKMPKALPLVIASTFSWAPYFLPNIYSLLKKWKELEPITAIELLLPYFQDVVVRHKAIDYIKRASSEFLFNFTSQFVEALRYEMLENSALAIFLLEQSIKDRRFAFELYWQLGYRCLDTKNSAYSARCRLLQELLLKLEIPRFIDEVGFQHLFLKKLDNLTKKVQETPDGVMILIYLKIHFYH